MGELNEVLRSIENHVSFENRDHYRNLSIGRGELMMDRLRTPKTIWILNQELQQTWRPERDITGAVVTASSSGRNEAYSEAGTVAVPKNREFARKLLQNYEGSHSCAFANGEKKTFLIKNSAHYTNTGASIINVHAGVAGMKSWAVFKDLREALYTLNNVEETIRKREEAVKEAVRKAEEHRKKKLEENARREEEEAQRLKQEIEEAQAKREAILIEARNAAAFIRKQVSLKRNPILDPNQDSAKFSNLYNGVAEVINGGPGTGKTTTMIQRLKLLIDRADLEDYIANHDDCKLTKEQLDIISSTQDNWVFFSPNDLLKKYLQDNMNYEGLTGTNHRTVVWKDFLKDAVRDKYHLAGQDCPFDFGGKRAESKIIYTGDHLAIIESFSRFFLEQVKNRFRKISQIDYNQFEWKLQGKVIVSECAKIEAVDSIESLLRFLVRMEGADKRLSANGKLLDTGAEIASKYNEQIRLLTDKTIALLKRDETKHNEAIEFVKNLINTPQPETEELDEVEEIEPDYGDLSILLFNKLNPILKKLALRTKDSSAKLTAQQKQLYEIVKEFINEEDLGKLADSAYFVKYLSPALRGFSQYVLTPIPLYYRQYRKSMPEGERVNWDVKLLKELVETQRNKQLLSQEQSLLIGFINTIVKSLFKVNREKFNNATHKYVVAYKELCRPVIGIDEASDYSLIEYYGIKSFGHYAVSSFTLCGDTMQLMKTDGITDWNQLRHPLLFDQLDIKELLISYRQSEELMNLADRIYQEEVKKNSPYSCYLKIEESPKPLWLERNDIDEKAEWIAARVTEIVRTYGFLPTIAIFTIDKRKAENLKEALDECDALVKAGIEVKVCSDNTLEGEKTLRIFPIDQVKGMEFEAVFFYDIDDIESSSLINKYLYVGLSRASMYLAVTSNGRSEKISNMLQKYFAVNATW